MRKSIFMVLLGLLLAVPAFAVNKAPVKELIVASDGEFTTITAALASLPDPNTTPTVIKVMPGTYNENQITMKSYVRLQGSGREVTTISLGNNQILLDSTQDNAITDLNINNDRSGQTLWCKRCTNLNVSNNSISNARDSSGEVVSVYWSDGPIHISNNIIQGTGAAPSGYGSIGMVIYYTINATVLNNIVNGSGIGAYIWGAEKAKVAGNQLNGNGRGMELAAQGSPVSGNLISDNDISDNLQYGIVLDSGLTSGDIIKNNKITGNAIYDIYGSSGGTPNVSFNVFDTTYGTISGSFNAKSDGTPW